MMKREKIEKLRSIAVNREWIEMISELSGDDFKKVFLAFYYFGVDGKEIDIKAEKNVAVRMALKVILPNVECMAANRRENADKSRNNGRKSKGRPRKNVPHGVEASADGDDAVSGAPGTHHPQPRNTAPRGVEASADGGEDAVSGAPDTHHPQRPVSDDNKEAYTADRLKTMFGYIKASFAASFAALLQHYERKDPKKLLPKKVDEYEKLYNKLVTCADGDANKARAVVNYTIENNYADIFEYKPKMAKYAAVAPGGADRRRGMDAKPHTLEEYEEDYFAGDPKPIGAAMHGVVGKML